MRECKTTRIPTREEAEAVKDRFEASGCQDVAINKEDDGTFTVVGQCND